MGELADPAASNSAAEGRVGSTPTVATMVNKFMDSIAGQAEYAVDEALKASEKLQGDDATIVSAKALAALAASVFHLANEVTALRMIQDGTW